jgi:lambda family phage tail tape measure protein
MASNLGKVYVELALDDKVYKQKLGETLTSATATAKGIETSWRVLGQKSDAIYEQQRRSAENAYTLIKNAATSTARDIIRAEEAKNAKLKALNEQQFGHHETMLEKLKANYIKAGVAIAGAMVVANKGWTLAMRGAEIEETKGILDNLARKYSTTADAIVGGMKRASEGMIANSDLAQIALGGLAKGLNPEQLIKLADAAKILGDSVGKNATEALNDLTQALESGRVKGLKQFAGTTIDLTSAFGDLEGKMTDAEKAQAMYSLIMIHATKLQKEQTKAVSDTADTFERQQARYKDYADTFSVVVMKMTVRLGDYLSAIGTAIQKTAQFFGLMKISSGATRSYGEDSDPMAGYKKQIEDLKKILATRVTPKAAKTGKVVDENAEIEKWYQQYLQDQIKASKNYETAMDNMQKSIQKGYEETQKSVEKYYADQRALRQDEIEARKHLLDMSEIEGRYHIDTLAERIELEKELLAITQKMEVKEGDASGLIAKQKAIRESNKNIYTLQKELSGSDPYKGMIAGIKSWAEEASNVGKNLESATKGWMTRATDALVEFCETGKTSFGDLARSIIKDLLSIMIQAQMANLAKSLFGSSGGGGGILGSIFGGLSGMSNSGDSVLSDWGGWSIGANGFAMQGGRRLAFAAGGIVNGPTIFPMANGMGLMGEAGPEAIMPLKRGSDGKLGVASTGSNITVNVPINGITDKSLVTDLKNSIEERVVEVIRRHS